MYHLWRGLEVAIAASVMSAGYPALANLRTWPISAPRAESTPKKKIAVMITMIPTITEVIQVSFQLVQVTFLRSASTSRRNCRGLNGRLRSSAGAAAPPVGALKGVRRRLAV